MRLTIVVERRRSMRNESTANQTQSLAVYTATVRAVITVRRHREHQLIELIGRKYLPPSALIRHTRKIRN